MINSFNKNLFSAWLIMAVFLWPLKINFLNLKIPFLTLLSIIFCLFIFKEIKLNVFSYFIFLFCQVIFGKFAPVTLKKLNNIVTNSVYHIDIPIADFVRTEDGVRETVKWIKMNEVS
jgi:hypothetical protein